MSTATLKGKITLDDTALHAGFRKGLSAASGFAKGVGSRLKSFITSPLAGIGAAVGAFFTYETFKSGISAVIEAGEEMQRLSKQTGVAVGSISMIYGAYKAADVSTEGFANSVGKMQKSLFTAATSGGQVGRMLHLLNLDVDQLLRLKPEEQFRSLGMAINKIQDPTARTAAAMAVFGQSGAELIPVFDEIGRVDFANLSEKARILERDSAKFEQITNAFKKAKANLQGVFLGLASSLAPSLLAAATVLSKKNALGFGQTLGEYIQKGVDILVGAFQDPKAFLNAFALELTANLLDAVTSMSSALGKVTQGFGTDFNLVSETFGSQMTNVFIGLGKALTGVLIKAFQSPIAWLQAKIEAMSERVKHQIDAVRERTLMYREGYLSEQINDPKTSSEKREWLSDALRETFATRQQLYKDRDNKLEEAFQEKYKRIMSEGVKFGFSDGGQTAEKWISEGSAMLKDSTLEFASTVSQAIGAAGDFGAGIIREEAQKAFSAIRAKGGATVASAGGASSSPQAVPPTNRYSSTIGGSLGIQGARGMSLSGLNRGAYGQTGVLSAAERRGFEDAAVANGERRQSSGPGAFNAIRSGDKARRREVEAAKERERLGIHSTNEWLSKIFNLTEEAWGNN